MSTDFALLIIDMLLDFFDRAPDLAAQRARLVAATNQLTEAVRSTGRPVIWIRQEFKPDLSDAFLDLWRRRIAVTIAGTKGADILPELKRTGRDHVLVKKRTVPFTGRISMNVSRRTASDRSLSEASIRMPAFARQSPCRCMLTIVDVGGRAKECSRRSRRCDSPAM